MAQPARVVEPSVAPPDPPARGLLRLAYARRGPLAAIPIVVAATVTWHIDHNPRLTVAPGAALVFLGSMLRTWAQCHLGYRLRDRQRFVDCGPYARVRNPIYLANTAII